MASFADVQYCIYADKVGGVRKWQFLLTFSTIYANVWLGRWVGQKKSKNVLT